MARPTRRRPVRSGSRSSTTGRAGDDEFFWRRDGSGFPVDFLVTPMFDGDRCVGGVLSFRDMTSRPALPGVAPLQG